MLNSGLTEEQIKMNDRCEQLWEDGDMTFDLNNIKFNGKLIPTDN
jgi:hypothetical protein